MTMKMLDPSYLATIKTVNLLQALDAAMKQYKALSPGTSTMFFSVDEDNNKILCMSCVPKVIIYIFFSFHNP